MARNPVGLWCRLFKLTLDSTCAPTCQRGNIAAFQICLGNMADYPHWQPIKTLF